MPDLTMTLEELAATLGKTVSTIRTQLVRVPAMLPPPVRIPGTRRLLWRRRDVEAFLNGCPATFQPAPLFEPVPKPAEKRGRGRPPKIPRPAHQGQVGGV